MTMRQDACVPELLALARGGDPVALGRLFELCRSYLVIVARAQVEGRLRAKFDPSDLVQQTLLEAYRDFGDFHGAAEAEWLIWLRRILTRNAADCLRHYRATDKRCASREVALRQETNSSSDRVFDPADPGESPSQQLLRKERELRMAAALDQLAPDHREVILLRNLQRLSFEEVARRMGRSRAAAQMLWTRALHKLQEALAPEPVE